MSKVLEYDGVVIGAGHNGMICAAYLAKCGQKIMVVEKNMEVGGGLDSHEDRNYPGFWHNIHSVFHRGLMMLPWFQDLELEKFGIHYYKPDPGVVHHFIDKTYLGWFANVKRTAASIEGFSKKDAATFLDIWSRWQPVVKNIVFPETYAVPVPIEEKRPLLEKLPEGREYLKYFETTPEEFVLQHFEHPRVQAFIGFLGVMRGYELDAPKTGYLIPAMIAWGVNPQLCRGTSHALGDNLAHMMSHNHVDYIEANGVERILVEKGQARAVVLEDGTVIKARKFIASNVNPVETFIKFVGRENLEPEFADRAMRFRFSKTTPIFATNLALNERPRVHHRRKTSGGRRLIHAYCRPGGISGPAQSIRRLPDRPAPAQTFHERSDAFVSRSHPGASGKGHSVHVATGDLQSLGQSAQLGQSSQRLVPKTVGGMAAFCAEPRRA